MRQDYEPFRGTAEEFDDVLPPVPDQEEWHQQHYCRHDHDYYSKNICLSEIYGHFPANFLFFHIIQIFKFRKSSFLFSLFQSRRMS